VILAHIGGVPVEETAAALAPLGLSLVLMLRRTVWSGIHVEHEGDTWRVVVEGVLTFLSVPRLSKVLGTIPGGVPVRLAVGFGSVWVNDDNGRVLRIRPQR